MLPEVVEYVAAVNEAQDTYEKEIKKLRNTYGYDGTYYEKIGEADSRYTTKTEAAKETLRKNAKYPLVRWIMENDAVRENYWSHAEAILKRLPATDEELHAYAKRNGWCQTWDYFRAQALADGAMYGYAMLQVQVNDGEWKEYRRKIQMQDGTLLTSNDVMQWFRKGAKSFEFKIRRSTYRFRVITTKPLA